MVTIMAITAEQQMQLFNYIIEFAQKNPRLRIEANNELRGSGGLRFNLRSTGATSMPNDKEPTVADLQQLSKQSKTGLPFEYVHFRTDDGGPGLANLKFEDGRFTVAFVDGQYADGYDERIIDFCKNLNEFMLQEQKLNAMSQEEKEYHEALNQLKNGLSKISSEHQKIIQQTQKMIEQVERLKKDVNTPIQELTESLNNTYATLNGEMTSETYINYAAKVEKSSSLGMKILGGIMMALGVLIVAAGAALAATGFGLASGIGTAVAGVAVTATGVGLFSAKKGSDPKDDELGNSSTPIPSK